MSKRIQPRNETTNSGRNMLESIDNYQYLSAGSASVSTTTNLQKQLINYKLQQKVLSDLLRQVLYSEGSDDQPEVSLKIFRPLVDAFATLLDQLVGNNRNQVIIMGADEVTIEDAIRDLQGDFNITSKFQKVLQLFTAISQQINQEFEDISKLVESQTHMINYLQHLISSHFKESTQIYNLIEEGNIMGGEKEKKYLSEIDNLANELMIKDNELNTVKMENDSVGKYKMLQEEITNRKVGDWREKYEEAKTESIEKDQVVERLQAQLEGRRPVSSVVSLNNEISKIQKLNKDLENLSTSQVEYIGNGSDRTLHIYSNYHDENPTENNLLDTIDTLNGKLLEKNSTIFKLNTIIKKLSMDNHELQKERINFKKVIMNHETKAGGASEKIEELEQNFKTCVEQFRDLLKKNIETYKIFAKDLSLTIDDSMSQVETKIKKLEKVSEKQLNFQKIKYYVISIDTYFQQAVKVLAVEHNQSIYDASEKHRKDEVELKELVASNGRYQKQNKQFQDQINKLREQVEQLTIDNNELRSFNQSFPREMFDANGNPTYDDRLEEITKRWKAEREARISQIRSAESRIADLEQEIERYQQLQQQLSVTSPSMKGPLRLNSRHN